MQTPLCTLLGIKTPIVLAPMFGIAGGDLASSVTIGGGFGFIGGGCSFNKNIPKELNIAKEKLSSAGKWSEGQILPIGVVDIALDSNVSAVLFSFGDAGELVQYVRQKSPSTKIFVQVQTVEEAVKAASEWKVDVIVVQGNECGGHGGVSSLTTFTFVPQVVDALSHIQKKPCIVAAGGVSKGSQIVGALCMGADGVLLGTSFLPCFETLYPDHQKNAIINAKDGSKTVRTSVFDVAAGLKWPDEFDGRALQNKTSSEPVPENLEEFRNKYKQAVADKDLSIGVVWAGQGVGLVKEKKSAIDFVSQLTKEANDALSRVVSYRQ